MELRFHVDHHFKVNTTIDLPEDIVEQLRRENVGSGTHITLTNDDGKEYDCLVNRLGNGFAFRIVNERIVSL